MINEKTLEKGVGLWKQKKPARTINFFVPYYVKRRSHIYPVQSGVCENETLHYRDRRKRNPEPCGLWQKEDGERARGERAAVESALLAMAKHVEEIALILRSQSKDE